MLEIIESNSPTSEWWCAPFSADPCVFAVDSTQPELVQNPEKSKAEWTCSEKRSRAIFQHSSESVVNWAEICHRIKTRIESDREQ